MYKAKTAKERLEDILAQIKDPDHIPTYTPIVYTELEVTKANTVLTRLLAIRARRPMQPYRGQILSMREVATRISI